MCFVDENKKRVNQWLNVNRLQLPLRSTTANSINSISKDDENVKYSLKDSEGNALTEEQQKFFADSKVRDEDGRLIPVYHGSNAEFTVFDRNRKGKGNDQYGAGFYFGTNTEISDMYGSNTYKSYLNITNPIKVHQAKYDGNNWFDIKITQQKTLISGIQRRNVLIKTKLRQIQLQFLIC